jgi:hypothetical protein
MRQEHYMTPGVLVSDEQAVPSGYVMVPVERLKHVHRDLDACQKVIWYHGGFDPAYCNDSQARLAEIDGWLSAAPAPAKCKCSMAISVLGDGCSVCNPEYLAEMLADQAEDEKEEAIAGLVKALESVLKVTRGSSGRIILDEQDEQDLRDVLSAHRQQGKEGG